MNAACKDIGDGVCRRCFHAWPAHHAGVACPLRRVTRLAERERHVMHFCSEMVEDHALICSLDDNDLMLYNAGKGGRGYRKLRSNDFMPDEADAMRRVSGRPDTSG